MAEELEPIPIEHSKMVTVLNMILSLIFFLDGIETSKSSDGSKGGMEQNMPEEGIGMCMLVIVGTSLIPGLFLKLRRPGTFITYDI